MLKKDFALCLRSVDYSDTSQILTFFCKDNGKISAIAKGSKRPKSSLGGPIDVFCYGQMGFFQGEHAKLATVREFDRIPCLIGLQRNLLAMNCGLFALELVNHFTQEHHSVPELFDIVIDFLKDIGQGSSESQKLAMLIIFQLQLISETGSAIVIDKCSNCKGKITEDSYFSSLANGLICRDCQMSFSDKISLSDEVIGCFSNLRNVMAADIKVLRELEKVIIFHISALLNKQPKMAKYFLAYK